GGGGVVLVGGGGGGGVVRGGGVVVRGEGVRAELGGGDAPADVLVADGAAEHRGTGAALGRFDRLTADHWALDVCEDLVVGFALVVVRVHVDDEKILVVALARLPRGMLEVLRGRIVLGGELAHFAAGHVQGRLLLGFRRDAPCTVPKRRRRYRRRAGRRRTFSTAAAGRRRIRRFAARIHNRPRADEMDLVRERLGLIGAVRRDHVDHAVDHAPLDGRTG